MTKLKFYGGIPIPDYTERLLKNVDPGEKAPRAIDERMAKGEIGGNIILVDNKMFWDFGLSFRRYSFFFTGFGAPHKSIGMGEWINLGLAPKIKGIYREDYVITEESPYPELLGEPDIKKIILTHGHIDHIGLVPLLKPEIEIFCGELSNFILKHFTETGLGSYHDYSEQKKSHRKKDNIPRKITTFKPDDEIKGTGVNAFEVDHSIIDSYGLIYNNIAYTADFRMHGRNPEKTLKFFEECRKRNIDTLITEGTYIERQEKNITESDVEKRLEEIINGKDGLVMCVYPVRDHSRLLSFYNAAGNNNRKLVINPSQAHLILLLENSGFLQRKGDLLYEGSSKDNSRALMPAVTENENMMVMEEASLVSRTWEKTTYENLKINRIDYKELLKNQKAFVFFCEEYDLSRLKGYEQLGLSLAKNSIYIHSSHESFDKHLKQREEIRNNLLEVLGVNHNETYQVHTTGHASGSEIVEMINSIPTLKKVIPIHTKGIKEFSRLKKEGIIKPELIIPAYGKEIEV